MSVASMNALEILRETARILRNHSGPFLTALFLIISPVSAALLLVPNSFFTHNLTVALSRHFMLLASTSGLPLTHFVRQLCFYIASKILSSAYCFPLSVALFLLAKTLVSYSIACVYAGKQILYSDLFAVIRNAWGRLVVMYLCICGLLVGCLVCFTLLLISVCTALATIGYPPEVLLYPAFFVALAFSIAYAHTIVVCNVAGVVLVLEEGSGLDDALYRSVLLIKGQTHTGLLIVLGSTFGLCFVEWLFEHRVRTLSYGDGSSRIWEGPLLVLMHSFVVLVDCMASAVFYFTCRSSSSFE